MIQHWFRGLRSLAASLAERAVPAFAPPAGLTLADWDAIVDLADAGLYAEQIVGILPTLTPEQIAEALGEYARQRQWAELALHSPFLV